MMQVKCSVKFCKGFPPWKAKIDSPSTSSIYTWDSLLCDKLEEEETEQDWVIICIYMTESVSELIECGQHIKYHQSRIKIWAAIPHLQIKIKVTSLKGKPAVAGLDLMASTTTLPLLHPPYKHHTNITHHTTTSTTKHPYHRPLHITHTHSTSTEFHLQITLPKSITITTNM